MALAGPGRRVLRRLLPVVYANVVEAVVLVLFIGVFLWMAARWLDRRPIVDYGFHLSRAWWLDLGFGLALGVFLMAGVYALARGCISRRRRGRVCTSNFVWNHWAAREGSSAEV